MITFIIILLTVILVGALGYLVYTLSKTERKKKNTSDTRYDKKEINNIKGQIGEYQVDAVLYRIAGTEGKVIENYVFMGDMRSVQIDHILITIYGVFVIETKNYAGTIYGEENQREWTQVINYGKVKNSFPSPIKQNAGHIYQLRKFLPRNTPVKGIVVFTKNNVGNITAEGVVGLSGLEEEINRLSVEPKLSQQDIAQIYLTLLENRKNGEISNEQHVNEIYKMREGVSNNKTCPRCGGTLVERIGKYGKFIGCSGYPKCKFKKDI